MKINSHIPPTKCKCHKGFSGMRRSEVRFNFSCNLIGNHSQSLTALTLDRYTQYYFSFSFEVS